MRYSAEFTAQAWVNDFPISVDPEGDTVWDCTDYVNEKFAPATVDRMLTNPVDGITDRLRDDPNAPVWIREWSGPFEIQLIES